MKLMKLRNELIALLLAGIMLLTHLEDRMIFVRADSTDYGLSSPRIAFNYRETILFGNYWQEDTNRDGKADKNDNKTPIKWQILEKYSDGTALVISDKTLDCKCYNNTLKTITWENSSIRGWLKSDFYNTAFSESEKSAIIESDIINDKNLEYGTNGGNNTKDKVFLLSLDDMMNSLYKFDENLERADQSRSAEATAFAKANGAATNSCGTSAWWLRSPGENTECATSVGASGYVGYEGSEVNSDSFGVRPAIRININSPYIVQGENAKVSIKGVEWDSVSFGRYEEKDIIWRVLNVNGEDAFLISDIILVQKKYNDEITSITWENSSLRKWLKDDFYSNCFSDSEKNMIKDTIVTNDDNARFYTSGGNKTTDKIYLLSLDEVKNPSYGFPNQLIYDSETRVALDSTDKEAVWWLRSPGGYENYAAEVDSYGGVHDDGNLIISPFEGVRPVLHINLSSSSWKKGESIKIGDPSGGSVILDSEPTPKPTPKPTATPTPTPKSSAEPSVSSTTTPQIKPTVSPQVTTAPVNKDDNKTTFSIKNKSKIKKTAKIKIKDKDKIKKVTLNGKKVKIKANKTSVTVKLKSYKKLLKKKGKWNTLVVFDKKGNKKTIKFKTK